MSYRKLHLHYYTDKQILEKINQYQPKRETRSFASRQAVLGNKSETNALGRKAANDQRSFGQKDAFNGIRIATLSDLLQSQRTRNASLARDLDNRAKARAADRRRFQPKTPGLTYDLQQQRGFAQTRFNTSAEVLADPSGGLGFRTPGIVTVCEDRERRREVLFALKKAKGHKTPKRRGPFSDMRC